MVQSSNNMRGSIGMPSLIIVSAIGLAGLYMANEANRTQMQYQKSQLQRSQDASDLQNVSQLVRMAGLINGRAASGNNVGIFYSSNYFAKSWTLAQQSGLTLNGLSADVSSATLAGARAPAERDAGTTVPTLTMTDLANTDFGAHSISAGTTSTTVSVLRPIVSKAAYPYYVDNLEVTATTNGKSYTALVPLNPPPHGKVTVMIEDLSSGTVSALTDHFPMNKSQYKLHFLVDGVTLNVVPIIDGVVQDPIPGFDSNGQPLSAAHDPSKTQVDIGSTFTLDMRNPYPLDVSKLNLDESHSCHQIDTNPGIPTTTQKTIAVAVQYVDQDADTANPQVSYTVDLPAPPAATATAHWNVMTKCPGACTATFHGVNMGGSVGNPDCWESDCNLNPRSCGTCIWDGGYNFNQEICDEVSNGHYNNLAFDQNMDADQTNSCPPKPIVIGGNYAVCANYRTAITYYKTGGGAAAIGNNCQNITGSGGPPRQCVGSPLHFQTNPYYNSSIWNNVVQKKQEAVAIDLGTCTQAFTVARSGCGCFAAKTQIQLLDGTLKAIDQLTRQDIVYNPVTRSGFTIRKMVQGPEKKPLLLVSIGFDRVEVTDEHPFPTRRGLITAAALRVGDEVVSGQGGYRAVSAIEWKSYDTAPVVWNLEIEAGADPSYHYVLADGIVTGDLYLQKQLKRQKADASRPLAHNNNL